MKKRTFALLVIVVLLGVDIALLVGTVSYANGAMECWRLNAMGLYILCPPQIPMWTWIATVGLAFALIAALIGVRRSSTR